MLRDSSGLDHGVLTGLGVTIASAIVLLVVFSIFRSTAPADVSIYMESAACTVSGDINTVASSAIQYSHEDAYMFDGLNISVSSEYVMVSGPGRDTFTRPLSTRIYPGRYLENGSTLWNNTMEMREYLNATFGAPGTRGHPISASRADELKVLLDRACRSMASSPIKIKQGATAVIEKTFIYTYDNASCIPGGEPFVFVYQR